MHVYWTSLSPLSVRHPTFKAISWAFTFRDSRKDWGGTFPPTHFPFQLTLFYSSRFIMNDFVNRERVLNSASNRFCNHLYYPTPYTARWIKSSMLSEIGLLSFCIVCFAPHWVPTVYLQLTLALNFWAWTGPGPSVVTVVAQRSIQCQCHVSAM